MNYETITKLLNLPDIIVVEALDCRDDHLHLVVTISENAAPPVCSFCGAVHNSVHSKGQMRVEDQSLLGRRVFLYLEKRKCRCPDGGIHVYRDRVLWSCWEYIFNFPLSRTPPVFFGLLGVF